MTTYTWAFGAGAEGWSVADMSFNPGDGDPSPGCMSKTGVSVPTAVSSITGLSIPVNPGDSLGFYGKLTSGGALGSSFIQIEAKNGGGGSLGAVLLAIGFGIVVNVWGNTTGAVISTTDTIASLEFSLHLLAGTCTGVFFDTVEVTTSAPPVTGFDLQHSQGGIPGSVLVVT